MSSERRKLCSAVVWPASLGRFSLALSCRSCLFLARFFFFVGIGRVLLLPGRSGYTSARE